MRGNNHNPKEFCSKNVKKIDLDIDAIQNCEYMNTEHFLDEQKQESDLVVLQLNVRGLINKQNDLYKILSNGSINKVDVVLLCKTCLRKDTNKLTSQIIIS